MPWDWIFTAIKAADTLSNERKREALIKKIRRLTKKKRYIIVFGISGVGKSQFLNTLKFSKKIPARTYATTSVKYSIQEFPIMFIDTPGHEEDRMFRKIQRDKILKDGVEGIINVVSYGYNETSNASRQLVFNKNGTIKQPFLKNNKIGELERLDEWIQFVSHSNINWIINLITKADLWWNDLETVENYYSTGTYGQKLEDLNKIVKIVTIPYCAIIKPYFDTTTSGKFGDIEKQFLQNNFITTLQSLLKKQK